MTAKRTSAASSSRNGKSSRRIDSGVKGATKAAPAGRQRASSTAKRPQKVTRPAAGARLRAELAKDGDPYGVTVLINQAARIADRLEWLDRLLSGDPATWIHLEAPVIVDVGEKVVEVSVEVRVDKPLLEERNQTTVLRHLMADIHKQRAGIPGSGDDDDDVLDGI